MIPSSPLPTEVNQLLTVASDVVAGDRWMRSTPSSAFCANSSSATRRSSSVLEVSA